MTRKLPYALIISGALFCSAICPGGQTDERPMFITIPRLLEPVKRAPVMFWHDKHAAALKEEGCQACHPGKAGKFEFSFPKERDESSRNALMDSFHNSCIRCHTKRSNEYKKTGPATCGECHANRKAYRQEEYLSVLPQDNETLRKLEERAKNSGSMDLKKFHVKGMSRVKLEWPETTFDYYTHDKHVKALNNKCELCHYISPALKQKLASEGREPTSQDWTREEEKGRSLIKRESAHRICLNCHTASMTEKKPGGPVNCKDCHTGRARSLIELKNIPRPDYGGRERILIKTEGGRTAAVPFDHKAHIAASRSCTDCHHKTLESCDKCHTLSGAKEGNFITIAEACHKSGSGRSCLGCHDQEKKKQDCAGCHHSRKNGLAASTCATCHTGKLESLDQVSKLPDPSTLFMTGMKDELRILILEKEYESVKVKHKEIASRLTDISNNSMLATFFHKKETTICAGCHHAAPVEKNQKVPACSLCHTERSEPTGNKPALLGAYHLQCLGCHKKMEYPEEKMPQNCAGCHKEKNDNARK